jgi:hypothetical protein
MKTLTPGTRAEFVTFDRVKSANDKTREITHVITSLTVDRSSEVIVPRGVDYKLFFEKNPMVFLNHRSWVDPPIGKCLSLESNDSDIVATTKFAGLDQLHTDAERIYRLYRDDFMRGWSVGVRVRLISPTPILPGQMGATIVESELMEYSAVGIPSNPDAISRMCKTFGLPPGATDHDLYEAVYGAQKYWTMALKLDDDGDPEIDDEVEKMCPKDISVEMAPTDQAWSAPALKDFTEKSWDDLSKTERRRIAGHYAYAKSMPPEVFGDLSLPHHDCKTGKVVWRGLMAAAGRLNQTAAIGADDIAIVRAHLAKHYKAFGKTPPWEKSAAVEVPTIDIEAILESVRDELRLFALSEDKAILTLAGKLDSIEKNLALLDEKVTKKIEEAALPKENIVISREEKVFDLDEVRRSVEAGVAAALGQAVGSRS